MDKDLVYIACPYTLGDVAENVHNAIVAAERIVNMGAIPYMPLWTHFWHMMSPKPHDYWMELDDYFVLKSDCVFRLPGQSHGADAEIARANKAGIPVFYSYIQLKAFIRSRNGSNRISDQSQTT